SLRRASWAGLCTLLLGSAWSACSIDHRTPNVIGGTGLGGASGVASLLGQDPNSPVQISPSTIDLGPVVVGAPARARLHIANNGMLPLDPPSVALGSGSDAAFSIIHDGCSGTAVPAGQHCDVLVQLLAARPGTISGQLAIAVAGSSATVPLSAVGNAAGAMILAPAVGSSDDFGSVRLTTSVQAVFTLTNAGGVASGPVSIHIYDADVTPVVGMAGGCSSGQTSLEPGQSCNINLTYGPSQRGATNALLVVTSAGAGSVSLPLTGRGTVAGVLGVSQPSLDFGGIALGDAGQRALHVVNLGDDPLALVGTTLDAASDFSISNSDCTGGRTLSAAAGCDVISEFRPATSGDGKRASLTVAMVDGSPQVVQLTGAGLDPGSLSITPVSGGSNDFGSVLLGAQSTQVFQVTNASAQNSGPLTLGVGGDFTLAPAARPGDCESGQTALDAAGATCTISVQLAPTRRAAQYGSLSVRSPLAKSASLALQGVGTAPARLALVQDEINFGHVLTGGTYQATVTVLNRGDQALAPPVPTLVDPAGDAPAGFSVENGCT
ncbi:MAG TPA: choice-of-anchor D domain-containing protein, partial [Polyangiaceae bacterium]|nr:choice-of-anchor D domain-containing protein [Polyangiaceae bacterium]